MKMVAHVLNRGDNAGMKVVWKTPGKGGEKVTFSVRISKELVELLDKISTENNVNRQRLIEAILAEALQDPKFVIELS